MSNRYVDFLRRQPLLVVRCMRSIRTTIAGNNHSRFHTDSVREELEWLLQEYEAQVLQDLLR
jgi:hypothetical protein